MASGKANAPERIRGFTSLSDHEASGTEGGIRVTEHDDFSFRRIWHEAEWWHSVVDVVGALTESKVRRHTGVSSRSD